jgi:hypothetical protein
MSLLPGIGELHRGARTHIANDALRRLLSAPAIGNNVVARADKRGESRAIRLGSYRDVRVGGQG